MNETPLVSICIPTYNGDLYIKECLNSAINQTYENIEIIISDDNSQDDTIYLINSILSKTNIDHKIITNHSSRGVADNWNNAIKKSSGQYIKMLFQDDYLYPDCIEKMISLAKNQKELGLIFSLRDPIYEEDITKDITGRSTIDFILNQKKYLGNIPAIQEGIDLIKNKYLLSGDNIIGEPSSVLINNNVFDEIGYFNPKLIQFIDLEMWYGILLKYKIGFINEPLTGFRIHVNQLSYNNRAHINQALEELLKILHKLYKNLIKLNFNKYYLFLAHQKIKKIIISKKKYWVVIRPFWKLYHSITKRMLRYYYT